MGASFGRRDFAALGAVCCFAALVGCSSCEKKPSSDSVATSASPSVPVASSSSAPVAPAAHSPAVHEGSTVAHAPSGDALYVADEDHSALRIVALPLDPDRTSRAVKLPGPPAQVVALDRRVLVTIRNPSLLLVLEPDKEEGLVERARTPLAADAWGVTVTPDEKTAIVSSAWSHQITAIELDTSKVRWSVDVRREPRGVAVRPDGTSAYVTHLVGSALTRIDGIADSAPKPHIVDLAPSPLRSPSGRTLNASLGYAAALSADGSKLFVARHALGALGNQAWFGAPTVDVLVTADDTQLAPRHMGNAPFLRADHGAQGDDIKLPATSTLPFSAPRAVVYRKSTDTVLVAGEGDDKVVELDAQSADPTLAVVHTFTTGTGYDANLPVASSGGAPSGIALSGDESTAWVFCRSTYDLAEIALNKPEAKPRLVHLADDSLDAAGALGRRIFYNATDKVTSGGVACAGCHPDGRDDGHVWHETKINTSEGPTVNFLGEADNAPEEDHVKGYPRRTPILAGRVKSQGPYGWHAESATLEARLEQGFGLHRWSVIPKHEAGNLAARASALAAFVRRGLPPPPRDERALTPEEEHGRDIFQNPVTLCARCHVRDTEYTDRSPYPMKLGKRDGFDEEERIDFKVPSLFYVGGHGTLLHDGSAASLDELIERNADRMGKTSQLTKEDRAALAAFLKTL